jgi:hypothetical protein
MRPAPAPVGVDQPVARSNRAGQDNHQGVGLLLVCVQVGRGPVKMSNAELFLAMFPTTLAGQPALITAWLLKDVFPLMSATVYDPVKIPRPFLEAMF